jgi:hypothetical protein
MALTNAEKKEVWPLSWPQDWPRTRPQDQKAMASWKKTANQYRDALVTELARMESPSAVISSNVPLNLRGAMTPGVEPRDVGVAVYFSRKAKEDFSWQDILGIRDPVAVTEAQVQESFKRLAALYHPDRGGDIAMFQKVTTARDNAVRWINRATDQNFQYVIASDLFREVRLNMAAIVMSIKAIRQLERCGTSSILERAFKGFSALPADALAERPVGAR